MRLLVVLQKNLQRLNTFGVGLVPSEWVVSFIYLLGCSMRRGGRGEIVKPLNPPPPMDLDMPLISYL